MIFDTVIDGFFVIVDFLINLIPQQSSYIDLSNISSFNDAIFDNLGLLDIIAPLQLIATLFGCIIALLIIKFTFSVVMFILKKIPFASMS